jgi:hypothetical protein
MGLSDQKIEIGHSIRTNRRNVYDVRNNEVLKIQTGYVNYDNNRIPVWRPFDPGDSSHDANWRNGIWKNIYDLRMPHKKNTRHIEYNLTEFGEGDTTALLPEVQVTLMLDIRLHINREK